MCYLFNTLVKCHLQEDKSYPETKKTIELISKKRRWNYQRWLQHVWYKRLLRSSEHRAYLWCSLLISSLIVLILMTVTSILSWKYSPCALSKRASFINCLPSSRTSYVSDSTDVKWLSTSWDTNQIKRKLTSFYGPVHSFVPGNQCLGKGTKWCCVHTLSTRYVTVYIVNSSQTPFLSWSLAARTKQWTASKVQKKYAHK